MKNAEKIEFSKNGLIIDGKKYGIGISKMIIESPSDIKVYLSKYVIIMHFDEMIKQEEYKDFCNPYDLTCYENIKLIEE